MKSKDAIIVFPVISSFKQQTKQTSYKKLCCCRRTARCAMSDRHTDRQTDRRTGGRIAVCLMPVCLMTFTCGDVVGIQLVQQLRITPTNRLYETNTSSCNPCRSSSWSCSCRWRSCGCSSCRPCRSNSWSCSCRCRRFKYQTLSHVSMHFLLEFSFSKISERLKCPCSFYNGI